MNKIETVVHDIKACYSSMNSDLEEQVKRIRSEALVKGLVVDALNCLADINETSLPGEQDKKKRINELADKYGLFYQRGKFY